MRASTCSSMAIASTSTRFPVCVSHTRRLVSAARRRDDCVVRCAISSAAWRTSGRRVSSVPRCASGGGEDIGDDDKQNAEVDIPSQWRDGPTPKSTFRALFRNATRGLGDGNAEDVVVSEPFSSAQNAPRTDENCDDPAFAASNPFCSISFIDESVDDGGEGIFVSPMDDRKANGRRDETTVTGGGAPVSAWPPWLAQDAAAAPGSGFDDSEDTLHQKYSNARSRYPADPVYPPPALVESAFVEVCAGKACGKAGSAEIHAAIANAAPGTWRCEQRKKCWGLCQAACVVRVTKGSRQETHVRVTPQNAVAVVLESENRDRWGVPRTSNFVFRRALDVVKGDEEQGDTQETLETFSGPSLPWSPPAAAGVLLAAKNAVDRGVPVADQNDIGTSDGKAVKPFTKKRPGLESAERASARAGVFQDAAEYAFGERKHKDQ